MSDIVTVYALIDLSHIKGIDIKEYGLHDGFKAGQAMQIPRMNAKNLIDNGVASEYPPPHYACKVKSGDDCPDPRLLHLSSMDTQRLNELCKSLNCLYLKKVERARVCK